MAPSQIILNAIGLGLLLTINLLTIIGIGLIFFLKKVRSKKIEKKYLSLLAIIFILWSLTISFNCYEILVKKQINFFFLQYSILGIIGIIFGITYTIFMCILAIKLPKTFHRQFICAGFYIALFLMLIRIIVPLVHDPYTPSILNAYLFLFYRIFAIIPQILALFVVIDYGAERI